MSSDLVELCRGLFFGPSDKYEEFKREPQRVLEEAGHPNVTPPQMHEAILLACAAPVDQGASVEVGGNQTTAPAPAPTLPPPPPPSPEHRTVEEYVTNVHEYYVTNNNTTTTTVDDRDTNIDNTNVVYAEEGSSVDIDQETAVSGDGGVSNTGSIDDSAIITGEVTDSTVIGGDVDDSVIGDGNVQANDNDGNVQIGGSGNTIQDVDGEGNQVANAGGDVEQNDVDLSFGAGGEGGSDGRDLTLVEQGGDQQVINVNVGSGSADATQEQENDILSPDFEAEVAVEALPVPEAELPVPAAEARAIDTPEGLELAQAEVGDDVDFTE